MKKLVQVATEYLPLILFFIFFKSSGLIMATKVVVISSLIMLGINYLVNKNLPPVTVISAVLLTIFGGITIFTNDPSFIKLKPTIVNILFALILFAGVKLDKPFLKKLLGKKIQFKDDQAWHKLAVRFAIFFSSIALLNEIIWRNFPDHIWVWFKTFGLITLNLIFIFSQMRFINKHVIDVKND